MVGRVVVIVGGGVAGVSAALAANRAGARTILIEAKRRVGISRSLMPLILSSDGMGEGDIVLPDVSQLEGRIEIRTNETISEFDTSAKRVRTTTGTIAFDSLVICTGSVCHVVQMRGLSKENVFVMKEVQDYLSLLASLERMTRVSIVGPLPLALNVGEVLATKHGKQVTIFCGEGGGLAKQFSGQTSNLVEQAAARMGISLVNAGIDAILGVERAEAVASKGKVVPCDGVVVFPRSGPMLPRFLECQRSPAGAALVDRSMRTSLDDVFAAGDCAELRFGSGSAPARLHSTSWVCGEVAGTNAGGGAALAEVSGSISQNYFGVECCSSGLTEEETLAAGLDGASMECLVGGRDERFGREPVFTSMVFDRQTHRVYGIQMAGWRASSWANTITLIVSLGLRVDQLLRVDFPYTPGLNTDPSLSPIRLTAARILGMA